MMAIEFKPVTQGLTGGGSHFTNATFRDRMSEIRLEDTFKDFKTPLNDSQAVEESNRCINCFDAPCIRACPTEINIPQFISRIASGNTAGSAKTILDSNIMGLSCAQSCPTEVLCEGACVYNNLNQKPIMIGRLQRFAVEHAYEKGLRFYHAGPSTGKRVALVGAGPASLACAHELRKYGHETIIFEKNEIPGGLNTLGIAPYKMKAETSLREIEEVAAMGVDIKYGQELGANLSLDTLIGEFDAVFLGLGLGPDSRMDASGADHPRIQGAVDFISHMKSTPAKDLSWMKDVKTALVVGGGNTALDACRELKGLGVDHVVVSYRRGEEDMSGYAHEAKWAKTENVDFWFHTLPTSFEAVDDHTLHAKINMTKILENGKVTVTDDFRPLRVGLVLVATGQSKLTDLLTQTSGIQIESGRLMTDEQTGRTGNPKIFAGGDLANGGKEVVNAVAEGKRSALAIHSMLGALNG